MIVPMRGMMGALVVALGLLMSVSHAREFTNTEGQRIVAEPDSVGDGKVIFQKVKGKKVSYEVSNLSQKDQDFLKEWVKTSRWPEHKPSNLTANV